MGGDHLGLGQAGRGGDVGQVRAVVADRDDQFVVLLGRRAGRLGGGGQVEQPPTQGVQVGAPGHPDQHGRGGRHQVLDLGQPRLVHGVRDRDRGLRVTGLQQQSPVAGRP